MRIPALFKELEYIGRAEGDRSTYHVFKGELGYLVVAPNNRGGLNVNVVNAKIPLLAKRSGRPDLFRVPFVPLNSLYVMVGLGRARKLNKHEGRAMVFKIQ